MPLSWPLQGGQHQDYLRQPHQGVAACLHAGGWVVGVVMLFSNSNLLVCLAQHELVTCSAKSHNL